MERDELETLAHSCLDHPALNNGFYDLWRTQRLNLGQVELVGVKFYQHVAPTATRLSSLLVTLPPSALRARSETVANINDELGHGDSEHAHTRLLEAFFDSLLSRLAGVPTRLSDAEAPVLPATRHLVTEGQKLFSGDPHRGVGALLAQEWHAYPQLIYLYEGARNYIDAYDNIVDFHSNCDFFYIHIGGAEEEHMRHSLSTAGTTCETNEQLALITEGFYAYLTLLASYWDSLHDAVRELS